MYPHALQDLSKSQVLPCCEPNRKEC